MAIHRIKLKDLNAQYIQSLKAQIKDENKEVAIWISDTTETMTEAAFWEIIALFDWNGKTEEDIIQTAATFLSQQSTDKIKSFEDVLSHQLFKLDGQKYAEHLGDNVYRGKEHPFSVDSFLYSRCYVVAKGKKFYQEVLQHPSKMPKNKSFEALLKLSSVAFKAKTGEKLDYIPTYIYETFANAEGWGGEGLLNKLFQI